MEQFKYGPLVYNTVESDDDSGNYYWPGNGMPPVGYDEYNIPIDSKGFQCLDAQQCPLHPHYKVIDDVVKGGKAMEYNEAFLYYVGLIFNQMIILLLVRYMRSTPSWISKISSMLYGLL